MDKSGANNAAFDLINAGRDVPILVRQVKYLRVRAKPGEADRSSLLLKCAAIGARLSRGDGSRPGRDQSLQSAWREFAIENGDSDLCKAVRAFVGPAHLALLGHALADDQIHGRFGDAAADWQAFSISCTIVDQGIGVVADVAADGTQIPPQP